MGGPLSCTMANYYLCIIENEILEEEDTKPLLYTRLIDDCFLVVRDEKHLAELQRKFEERSVLRFTYEIGMNNRIPYLDVLINNSLNDRYITGVYTKPTKSDDCINYECAAPERYKTGVIKTLMNRAIKICNTLDEFEKEKKRIKALLVNNNFPNYLCDKIMEDFSKKREECGIAVGECDPGTRSTVADATRPTPQDLNLQSTSSDVGHVASGATHATRCIYYRNQFNSNYRLDENALKKIIKNHVFQVNIRIKLLIFYKNKKVSDLLIRNNISTGVLEDKDQSHLVYEFVCQEGECKSSSVKNSYIGLTTMTLKDRLSAHRYQGSILEHFRYVHDRNPKLPELIRCTKVIYKENDAFQLAVYEALHIRKLKPNLNENINDFQCLKLNIY